MTQTEMTVRFSPKQDEIFKATAKLLNSVKIFEYEGMYFHGDKVTAAIEFAYNNPTGGDLYVWLQKHYTRFNP